MMKRIFAIVLCVLMLGAMTACNKPHDHDHSLPSTSDIPVAPAKEDATDSVFVGTWHVSSATSTIDTFIFNEDGAVQAKSGISTLGGVFYDDGEKLSIHISQNVISGPYTVEGDKITLVTDTATFTLTKVA